MKTEKISDVLQGMDVNTEDAIVTLSDKVWEIGELSEIKNQVSDAVFAFYIVANVIGHYCPVKMDKQFFEIIEIQLIILYL